MIRAQHSMWRSDEQVRGTRSSHAYLLPNSGEIQGKPMNLFADPGLPDS